MRALAVYVFLLVILRAAGQRTLSEITPFEFVLLLVVGEATQQALLGDDFSLINAFLVILTFIGVDVALSLLKQRWNGTERLFEGLPILLVDDGQLLEAHMRRARVDVEDILEAGRLSQGLERLDQVKYAVLEKSGGISIVPK